MEAFPAPCPEDEARERRIRAMLNVLDTGRETAGIKHLGTSRDMWFRKCHGVQFGEGRSRVLGRVCPVFGGWRMVDKVNPKLGGTH